MYKIIIKGEANAFLDEEDFPTELLYKLKGVEIPDEFVEYLDKDYADKLDEGYTEFIVEDNKLYAVCKYFANEELTQLELESLVKYTQGQWSDGIGEGFEQQPCMYIDNKEVFISPWQRGQVCTVEQIKL